MSGSLLLETAKWRDVVELGLCMAIHDVCNDSQFENCTPLDFANFLNVREEARAIAVVPKEKLRVCYMVYAVARNISPRKEAETWARLFLQRCNIAKSYYDKHRSDICADHATEDNKNYRESIDTAIESWRSRRRIP